MVESKGFKIKTIAGMNISAMLLLLGWYLNPLDMWSIADERVFYFFNSFIGEGYAKWERLLALTNMRIFDLVSASFLGALFLLSALLFKGEKWWQRWVYCSPWEP